MKIRQSQGASMIEPVESEDFSTKQDRRKPEQFQFVKFRVEAGAARLTLNRPEHNLLNEAMLRELADGITFGEYTSQRVFQMLDAFHAVFAVMLDVGKPVVSVVNGQALGGGVGRVV